MNVKYEVLDCHLKEVAMNLNNTFINKIKCFFGFHKFNITDLVFFSPMDLRITTKAKEVYPRAHLECRYCNKKTTSEQEEICLLAQQQKDLFNKELNLTRQVLIEKIPSLHLLLKIYARKKGVSTDAAIREVAQDLIYTRLITEHHHLDV